MDWKYIGSPFEDKIFKMENDLIHRNCGGIVTFHPIEHPGDGVYLACAKCHKVWH